MSSLCRTLVAATIGVWPWCSLSRAATNVRELLFACAAVAVGAAVGVIASEGTYWLQPIGISRGSQYRAVFNAFFLIVYIALPSRFAVHLTVAFVGCTFGHRAADLDRSEHTLWSVAELASYLTDYVLGIVGGIVLGHLARPIIRGWITRTNTP